MSDSEFEEYFDNGGDVTEFMVDGSLAVPNRAEKCRKGGGRPAGRKAARSGSRGRRSS